MRKWNWAAGVAILSTTLIASAASATTQSASLTNCVDMAEQVKTALAANEQSPNYQEAVKEQAYGREFCTNSFYQSGVSHYGHALDLLGAARN